MTLIEWPLHTRRLSLRGYLPDDLDELWSFERLPQVQRWLGWAPHSQEELHQKMTDESSNTIHIVVLLESAIIGHIMIMPRDGWAQLEVASRAKGVEAELGWMFHPAYAQQGYAAEAVEATIGLCFTTLDLRRVRAGCFADNVPSWRLMERLKLRREEHSRATALHRDGTWHDSFGYALLREEWPTGPDTLPGG